MTQTRSGTGLSFSGRYYTVNETINDGYEVLDKPDAAELKKYYDLGQDVARRVKAL